MRGKGLLLIGAIAGAIFATTPRGRKVVQDVKDKAQGLWARPDVQRRVSGIQTKVRSNVPVVGGYLADAVDGVKPQASTSTTTNAL